MLAGIECCFIGCFDIIVSVVINFVDFWLAPFRLSMIDADQSTEGWLVPLRRTTSVEHNYGHF